MSYFDCFVAGSWMFVLGWYVGAIYVQNHNHKKESSRVVERLRVTESIRLSEKSERCPECGAWRLPVAARVSADWIPSQAEIPDSPLIAAAGSHARESGSALAEHLRRSLRN